MEEEDEQQKLLQTQGNDSLSSCPSFNTYSSERFAEIAARISENANRDSKLSAEEDSKDLEDDEDDNFEFSLVQSDSDPPAEEIFYGGQFRPIFPIFDRTLLLRDKQNRDCETDHREANCISLRNLLIGEEEREDRDDPPSCSSSEANDELESIPSGTYCVWRPKLVEDSSPMRCQKSNSTGSVSKRWKFRDLLRRCNSEGKVNDKDSFVFLTPKNRREKKGDRRNENSKIPANAAGKLKVRRRSGGGAPPSPSAHEVFYVRNKALKESDKRKSYLPYRQDLVGFFANVNGLNRTFSPF